MSDPRTFTIAASHPALAGHFPGHPVVPAVVILEAVLARADGPVVGVRSAKFLAPLGPDEPGRIEFTERSGGIGFRVTDTDGGAIAHGELRLGAP